VISCGFWPGSGPVQEAAFYAYAVPAPSGLEDATIRPASAWYSNELGEFLLRYDDVRLGDSLVAVGVAEGGDGKAQQRACNPKQQAGAHQYERHARPRTSTEEPTQRADQPAIGAHGWLGQIVGQ